MNWHPFFTVLCWLVIGVCVHLTLASLFWLMMMRFFNIQLYLEDGRIVCVSVCVFTFFAFIASLILSCMS